MWRGATKGVFECAFQFDEADSEYRMIFSSEIFFKNVPQIDTTTNFIKISLLGTDLLSLKRERLEIKPIPHAASKVQSSLTLNNVHRLV